MYTIHCLMTTSQKLRDSFHYLWGDWRPSLCTTESQVVGYHLWDKDTTYDFLLVPEEHADLRWLYMGDLSKKTQIIRQKPWMSLSGIIWFVIRWQETISCSPSPFEVQGAWRLLFRVSWNCLLNCNHQHQAVCRELFYAQNCLSIKFFFRKD